MAPDSQAPLSGCLSHTHICVKYQCMIQLRHLYILICQYAVHYGFWHIFAHNLQFLFHIAQMDCSNPNTPERFE